MLLPRVTKSRENDVDSAFGICATDRYRVLCGNLKE
jgi:hypothetical protein